MNDLYAVSHRAICPAQRWWTWEVDGGAEVPTAGLPIPFCQSPPSVSGCCT